MQRRFGDWNCSCGELNFASRVRCRSCGADKAGGGGAGQQQPQQQLQPQQPSGGGSRPGDWTCPNCNDTNFAFRNICRKCDAPRVGGFVSGTPTNNNGGGGGRGGRGGQGGRGGGYGGGRPGDWNCPCGEMNFASRNQCRRCNGPRSLQVRGRPGDWTCSCGELNFANRTQCRQCDSLKGGAGQTMFRRPGDWMCTCGELNFMNRTRCRKCEAPCTSKPPTDPMFMLGEGI
eukprot:PhF_6_TR18703/c1_g1_i1/m.27333